MKLSIYSLEKTLFEGEAEKIIARSTTGEITILDEHVPIVTLLKGPGVDVFDKSGKKNIISFSSGVLEVRPESEAVILANQ